jgi:hypothetical protein
VPERFFAAQERILENTRPNAGNAIASGYSMMKKSKIAPRETAQLDTGTVLYYPNFRMGLNELKLWLLFWDRVRCIVPKTSIWAINDSGELAVAIGAGYLIDTPPEDYRIDAADDFRAKVIPLLSGNNRRGRQFLNQFHLSEDRPGDAFNMHINKMSPGLIEELTSRKLIRHDKDEEWLSIRSAVGGLYMVCLASTMSEDLSAPIVTDKPEFRDAGEYLLFGSYPITRGEIPDRSVLGQLGLAMPSADDLEGVRIDRILRFKEKHAQEMTTFRTNLLEILDTTSQLESPSAVKDFFAKKRQEIQRSIRDHQLSLREIVTVGVGSALKISAPASVAAVANHLKEFVNPTWLVAAGLSILFSGWWAEVAGKRRKLRKECPWLYSSMLERHFPRRRKRAHH